MSSSTAKIEATVKTARSQVGFRAAPGKVTPWRESAGDWAGSFVAWVLAENDCLCPRLDDTTAGLAWFATQRRLYQTPKPGDIAFYGFTFNGQPGQPHVGLVVDTLGWKTNGEFRTVEGQLPSPRPRENQDPIGIYERSRFRYDVIAFARPDYSRPATVRVTVPAAVPTVRPAHFQRRGHSTEVATVQLALGKTVGLANASRGIWDAQSRSAYACWQRIVGLPGTGQPTVRDLILLASRTRLFNVRD